MIRPAVRKRPSFKAGAKTVRHDGPSLRLAADRRRQGRTGQIVGMHRLAQQAGFTIGPVPGAAEYRAELIL